jgi:hypothetical protein
MIVRRLIREVTMHYVEALPGTRVLLTVLACGAMISLVVVSLGRGLHALISSDREMLSLDHSPVARMRNLLRSERRIANC